MIFDHDQEEEEELAAMDAQEHKVERSGLGYQSRKHAAELTSQGPGGESSSSSSEEEDEEQVRTDIIKYKKRLKKE